MSVSAIELSSRSTPLRMERPPPWRDPPKKRRRDQTGAPVQRGAGRVRNDEHPDPGKASRQCRTAGEQGHRTGGRAHQRHRSDA